jgi:hypothetical protein
MTLPLCTPPRLRRWVSGRFNVYLYNTVRSFGLAYLKRSRAHILGKSSRERFLAADFLTAHERVNGHCDCAVDVMRRAKVGKPHLAERLGDAHDGFQMADLHETCLSAFAELSDRTEMGGSPLTVIG